MVIESVWGLGEGVVCGEISPHKFVVDWTQPTSSGSDNIKVMQSRHVPCGRFQITNFTPHHQSSGDVTLTGRVEDWCGKVTHQHMVEQKIKFALKQHVSSGSGAAGAVPVKPVSSSTGSDHKAHDAAAAGAYRALS